MKLVLRVLGTWFLGLGLVLLIMDGTRSLSANEVVMTPMERLWPNLHAASWGQVQDWIATYLAPWSLDVATAALFGWPAWVPAAILGMLCLVIGRKRRKANYIDRI